MCGICGYLHFDSTRPVSLPILKRMSEKVIHRGPDGQGFHIKDNIALAHQRLAIIDLSSGHQPMFSADRRLIVVSNGEIYNYLELREELRSLGHNFHTESDTEVIIVAYQQWGLDLHKHLNGMWAFALWDDRQKLLLLSRDRMGEKPLHYAVLDDTLLFASEIKSILAYRFPREANLDVLEIYLTLGYIPAPFTFFKNIHKLRPGHYLVARDNHVHEYQYWDIPNIDENHMLADRQDIDEQFTSLFHDSVRLRMRSDVSYGAFLSGGLDSSSIVALMSDISDRPIETFTIGFDERRFDERQLARDVAEHFSTNHHEYTVTPDAIEDSLDAVHGHFDEPFGDSTAIPTAHVSRYAREKVKMVLTGDGGDEALSGYNSYQSEKFISHYKKLPAMLRKSISLGLGLASKVVIGSLSSRLTWLHNTSMTLNFDLNDRLLVKASWLPSHLLKELVRSHAHNTINPQDFLADLMNKCSYQDNFYRMMYYNIKLSLPENMLTKVDRMSMAHSIEARLPFLDHRLMEFMVHVHKDIKMQGYERKSVLRRTIGQKLPHTIMKAPKKGFVVPLNKWFRQEKFSEQLPRMLQLCPLDFDRRALGTILKENISGQADHSNFIWMLFVLSRWFKG